MQNEELTPGEVAQWFQGVPIYGVTIPMSGGKTVSKEQVQAYVQKLEQRVMRLAAKLADQA